jgi:hypothetical protein
MPQHEASSEKAVQLQDEQRVGLLKRHQIRGNDEGTTSGWRNLPSAQSPDGRSFCHNGQPHARPRMGVRPDILEPFTVSQKCSVD